MRAYGQCRYEQPEVFGEMVAGDRGPDRVVWEVEGGSQVEFGVSGDSS